MKPADRSKLILTIGAASVIVGLGYAINSWQNQGKILPSPAGTPTPLLSVSTAAVTAATPVEPPPEALTPEAIDQTFKKVTKRLIATIDNQKKLDLAIEEAGKVQNQNPATKQTSFTALSSRQSELRDNVEDIIFIMRRLRHEASIPTAKKALNAAYKNMDEAAKLLLAVSVPDAIDRQHEAIRNMEIAFTVISHR